jgi:hypothetical protein
MATNTPLLRGPDNPDGWRLDELIARLRQEVLDQRLTGSGPDAPRRTRRTFCHNSWRISALLEQAERIHRHSLSVIDAVEPRADQSEA